MQIDVKQEKLLGKNKRIKVLNSYVDVLNMHLNCKIK